MLRDPENTNIPYCIRSSGHPSPCFNRKILDVALVTPAVLLNQHDKI